ncbi:MAG: thioredoxin family protein [Candidatus Auribacterota bacterium]
MKDIYSKTFIVMTSMLIIIASAFSAVKSQRVPLGSALPEFSLPGVDGKTYSKDSFADAKALVVVITCNHCPYAKASWPVLIGLQDEFKDKGVQFVGINPNDAEMFPEDNFDNMVIYSKELGINFPYLRDESQETARALEAVCTPDVYVYGADRTLYYHGRINDNWQKPDQVQEHSLKNALNSLLNGEPAPEDQEPSFGCSIKWK